jgi:hypothetical protein
MNYWAWLNSAADQAIIRQGAENLANVARATQSTDRRGGNLRIEDAGVIQNPIDDAAGGDQGAAAGSDGAAPQ